MHKKVQLQTLLQNNHVINSVVFVSFVVVVLSPNVIYVSYDNDDNDKILEARAGTMGKVDLAVLKTLGECYRWGKVLRIY